MRAVLRLGELYPGIRLTTEEKARKNLSQGSRTIRTRKPTYNETVSGIEMLVTFYDLDHSSCSTSKESTKLGNMQRMLISCSSVLIYTACENCFRSLAPVMQLLTVISSSIVWNQ